MSKENSQRDYWSSNLDVKNLGGGDSLRRFNLEEELDFYFSPEQLFALKKLWGEEGLRGKRILEIGGGMGVFALFLATQEADVYVADIAPARIYFLNRQAQARGLASRIHAVCAAAEALPFADDFFDAVYTKSVLIHTELEKAAQEAARVDGGGVSEADRGGERREAYRGDAWPGSRDALPSGPGHGVAVERTADAHAR